MSSKEHSGNHLFPAFLKLENMKVLVVGGMMIAEEKLLAILKNSPQTSVMIVADQFSKEVLDLVKNNTNIQHQVKRFEPSDVDGYDVVFGATSLREFNTTVRIAAKDRGKLVNIADMPDLCDFYLSSVVQKGDLKIAISSNGKSPMLTIRFREYFEKLLPDDVQSILDNLQSIRANMEGDFNDKLEELKKITSNFNED